VKLTCIGCCGPYPKPNQACTGYLIQNCGSNVVLDLGCGTLSKLLCLLRADQIDTLILSHLHSDHMGDALTLRYALEVARKLGRRDVPLPVYLPDTPEKEAGLLASHPMIDARYISDGMACLIGGMEARFALMPHAVPSFAVSLEADGKRMVYSGDVRDGERLVPFTSGADLLLMEAALLAQHKTEGAQHVSAAEAGDIAAQAKVKRLIITHIFPEYDESAILKEVREGFPEAELAYEFGTYEV